VAKARESPGRRLARTLWQLPERLLHPLWRRRALARLRACSPPRSVVFVCHGNICRSPYAAAAFVDRLAPSLRSGVRVDSAGFTGPGRASPPEAVAIAARHGVALGSHRAQLVPPGAINSWELVVVMEPRQAWALHSLFGHNGRGVVVLGDLDPMPFGRRTIADPVEQPEAAFEASYTRIDRCLGALIGTLYPNSKRL
jgi:protein-tyrosine-phosphatase